VPEAANAPEKELVLLAELIDRSNSGRFEEAQQEFLVVRTEVSGAPARLRRGNRRGDG
jgi:hypothetical protein